MIADPETADRAAGRPGRRDLGLRPQRRPGLLEAAARKPSATFQRLPDGHRRRPVPAHRRPGLPARRRAVHHRPAEGPDHHPRPQPLSAGHRADGRASSHPRLRPGNGRRVHRRAKAATSGWSSCRRSSAASRREAATDVFDAIRRAVAAEHELRVDAIVLIKAGSIPKTSSGKIQRHACRAGVPGPARWTSWPSGTAGTGERIAPAGAAPPAEQTAAGSRRRTARDSRDAPPARAPRPVDGERHHAAHRRPDAAATAEIVLEHVRRVAKERAVGIDARHARSSSWASTRWSGWRSSPSLEETLRRPHSPRTCCRRSKPAAKWSPPSKRYLGNAPRAPHRPAPARRDPAGRLPLRPVPRSTCRLRETTADARHRRGLAQSRSSRSTSASPTTRTRDRRPRADQLLQLQLPRHVGRSARWRPPPSEAIDRYGTSVSASRLVSGEKTIHRELEQAIADFIGAEAADRLRRRPLARTKRRSATCSAPAT